MTNSAFYLKVWSPDGEEGPAAGISCAAQIPIKMDPKCREVPPGGWSTSAMLLPPCTPDTQTSQAQN